MSTINSETFNAGSGGTVAVYSPGDPIDLTVNYTPDVPSVVIVPTSFTATTTITDQNGNVTATSDSPFTVNVPATQPGDTASESDTGGRTWTPGATAPQADGSLTVAFATTA